MTPPLVCPICREPLSHGEGEKPSLTCGKNHGPWPIHEGIPYFCSYRQSQEKRWVDTYPEPETRSLFRSVLRRNRHWGIPFAMEPFLSTRPSEKTSILDLGCGGGWEFLLRYGEVIGIDQRPEALRSAGNIYQQVVGSDLKRVPYPDHSFDVICSVWVMEHLRDSEFLTVLREVRRLLKPDGQVLFWIDLHSAKPILRWARSHPVEYEKYHVQAVGHYGLRSLKRTEFLLRRAGFEKEETIPVQKSSLLQPVTMSWMFDNELGRKSLLVWCYVRLCRFLRKNSLLHRGAYQILSEYHRWADRRLPDSYAFSALFAYRRGTVSASPPVRSRSPAREAGEESRRRPVLVVIDNSRGAFPQVGLPEAKRIFQVPVEGHRTRLLALYGEKLPDLAGPVRSVRPYMLDLASGWQSFLLHCGSSPEADQMLENPLAFIAFHLRYVSGPGGRPLEVMENEPLLQFDLTRESPHFVMARPKRIFQDSGRLHPRKPPELRDTPLSLLQEYAPSVSGTPLSELPERAVATRVRGVEVWTMEKAEMGERFIWQSVSGAYHREVIVRKDRSLPAGPTRDPDLRIDQLIVLEVVQRVIPGDLRGRLDLDLIGEGPGYLWRKEGVEEEIYWRKTWRESPFRFFLKSGEELTLEESLTWIHLIGPEGVIRRLSN